MKWRCGDRGYVGSRYVGDYVGVHPRTDSLVFVKDNEFRCYHHWQVLP